MSTRACFGNVWWQVQYGGYCIKRPTVAGSKPTEMAKLLLIVSWITDDEFKTSIAEFRMSDLI